MLDVHEQFAHILRNVFAQQETDVAIKLVHVAHGADARCGFGDACAVPQSGGAVVACACGDL